MVSNSFLAKPSLLNWRVTWKYVRSVTIQRRPVRVWLPQEDDDFDTYCIKTLSRLSWTVCLSIQTWNPSSYLDSTLRCVNAEVTETRRCLWTNVSTLKHGCPYYWSHIWDIVMSVLETNLLQVSCISCTLLIHVIILLLIFFLVLGIGKVCSLKLLNEIWLLVCPF